MLLHTANERCDHLTQQKGLLLDYGGYTDRISCLPICPLSDSGDKSLFGLRYLRSVCYFCKATSRDITKDTVTKYVKCDTNKFSKALLINVEYYLQNYHNFLEVLFDDVPSCS